MADLGKAAYDLAGKNAIDPRNRLSKTIVKMQNGSTVKIVCYGDSITYGQTSAGPQSANPYPSVLQVRLQKVFSNTNITVINNGNPGQASDWLLNNINTVLSVSPDLCILMTGINDANPALSSNTPDMYKANTLAMVSIFQSYGIEVLLMSPTEIIKPTSNRNTGLLTYVRAAQEAARIHNTPYIDMHSEIHKLFSSRQEIPNTILGDQVHFIEGKYFYIADIITRELDYHNSGNALQINSQNEIRVPIANSPFIDTDITGANINANISQYQGINVILQGDAVNGTKLKLHFFIDVQGMDLLVVGARSFNGGIATFLDNGTALSPTVDFNSSMNAIFDAEMMVYENIPRGFHTIELLNTNIALGSSQTTTGKAYMSEFLFRKSKQPFAGMADRHYKPSGSLTGTLEKFNRVVNNGGKIRYIGNAANPMGVILSSESRAEIKTGKKLVIEAEGTFAAGTAFTFFSNAANNTFSNHTGYMFYTSGTGLSLFLGDASGNGSGTPLATYAITTPDYTVVHKVRIELTDVGVFTIFWDGVQAMTVTNTKEKGGFFGLYTQVGVTLELTRLEYAYI